MRECLNKDCNDNLRLIYAQSMFCDIQSGAPKYDGPDFEYCPFCGHALVSKIDQPENKV